MDKVLCIIRRTFSEEIDYDEQQEWLDLEPFPNKRYRVIETVIPVYDHPHTDKENGQIEAHYHMDTRYVKYFTFSDTRITLPLKSNERLEYKYLRKYHQEEQFKTPTSLIRKSKLKHKCIHKGKCPHRGFDLSNTAPTMEGIGRDAIEVITCPLHGLKFNYNTKKLIE